MEAGMIRIIADTTCALPRKITNQLGIPILPQIIIFGEESFRDDTELTTELFLKKLRSSPVLPKTAAPPPALYGPIFREILDRGDIPFVMCPSADISGTLRSAEVAAQDFPGAGIRVLDTRTVAGTFGATVLLADRWAKQGVPMDKLLSRLENLRIQQRTYFVVDTLEYLHKGGRIGGAKRLVGEMLQVKPILRLLDGRVEAYEQQRTRARALARLQELVIGECSKGEGTFLCVMQADAEDTAKELANVFTKRMEIKEVPIYELPPAIVVHGGPGTLAVGFFAKPVL
jgi:DegV family protein with EDD domain